MKRIETSLVTTLKESDLKNVSAEMAEYFLDNMLENDVLKSIPVFRTLQSIYKSYRGIRDMLFVKKLCKFLFTIQEIPREERQEMINKLESDDNYKQKVGEQLIFLLDRMDDMDKPVLLAQAFIAYSKGLIDIIQLQRISFGIDHVFIYNLSELKRYYLMETDDNKSHDILEPMVFQNLANCGFVNLTTGYGSGVGIHKNELGKLFVEHILRDEGQA
ncbi:hypothetical protein [Candidatus Parabeggiatoa sp. HSG14]|uniref:hypothetical protein n=1 Tax=Candidatus Parabeggiatoa sp. HSG14 TaxID=3055593 RepID=UPI0025A6F585|nr:hypothetical protein [Thiotrichales bacterium HSG14]